MPNQPTQNAKDSLQALAPLIVLDLEWNQRYGKQQGIPSSLPQEIVEIGAVKLDASMGIADRFQATVRPVVHPVLHRHVQRVTGISAEDCREGLPFREAGAALMAFCGEAFTLCTWGPDDYPVLQRNLAYWSLPQDWARTPLDAQKMYAHLQGTGQSKQVSLQAAMEVLGIAQEFPSHRALHDAYHTALVVQKLRALADALQIDDPRHKLLSDASAEYAQRREERSTVRATAYRTADALLADESLFELTCPYCDAPVSAASKRLSLSGQQTLEQFAACKSHGTLRTRFVPQRTASGTLSLRTCISPATEQQMRQFLDRYAKQNAVRTRRTGHRGGRIRAARPDKQ